jgi:hypothetical protein
MDRSLFYCLNHSDETRLSKQEEEEEEGEEKEQTIIIYQASLWLRDKRLTQHNVDLTKGRLDIRSTRHKVNPVHTDDIMST